MPHAPLKQLAVSAGRRRALSWLLLPPVAAAQAAFDPSFLGLTGSDEQGADDYAADIRVLLAEDAS